MGIAAHCMFSLLVIKAFSVSESALYISYYFIISDKTYIIVIHHHRHHHHHINCEPAGLSLALWRLVF